MTKFTIDIPDDRLLSGLAWAKDQHNATLGEKDEPFDDESYLQHVIDGAVESYAKSAEIEQSPAAVIAQKDAKIAALQVENDNLKAAAKDVAADIVSAKA